MRRWTLTLVALFLAALNGEAVGQVMQTGGVIPQHLTMWSTNNVVQDAGGAARLPQGLQPFEFGLVAPPNQTGNPFPATATGTGPNGENSCLYDSPLGQAGHYLCFSPNLGANLASITSGAINGGTPGGLQFIINGTKVSFPGPGTGTVVGPGSSTVGDITCWNNTLGTIVADCGPTGLVQPLAPTATTGDNSTKVATTAFVKNQGYLTSTSVPVSTPQGRLTLTSHTPVLPSGTSINNVGIIYYDAYLGNSVPIYNGTTDVFLTIPSNEAQLILTSLEEASSFVFDVFAINVSGTLTLCTPTNAGGTSGKGWAGDTGGSNTARGTGYSQLSNFNRSYVTNANVITNCFGGGSGTTNFGPISANQASYLGTYFTTAAGQTSVNFGGGATGGLAPLLYLWNYYNRVIVNCLTVDTGTSYTYNGGTREARASSGNQINFVIGVGEDGVTASYYTGLGTPTNNAAFYGIGLDTITNYSLTPFSFTNTGGTSSMSGMSNSSFFGNTLVGAHFFAALEQTVGLITFNSASGTLSISIKM